MNIKKSRIISFRVDELEYQSIKTVAREMGFFCLSDYARQVLLESLGSKCSAPSVDSAQLRKLTRLLDDLTYEARNLLSRSNRLGEEPSEPASPEETEAAPGPLLHDPLENPTAQQPSV
jgi:hypothetical protein